MHDFNDLAVFAAVVESGSFTGAARSLGIAKSQASHRVARLEERLGLRLIQRTTRQLHVTEVGQRYYRHCRGMLVEAGHAQRIADAAHVAPNGHVRVCCPALFGELILGPIAADFMRDFADVHLTLDTSGQSLDVIGDGYDVVFRVRPHIADSSLVVRSFGVDRQVLVASPDLLARYRTPDTPEQLTVFPSMDLRLPALSSRHLWYLSDTGRSQRVVDHHPRLVTDDMLTLRRAALMGLGLVVLPRFMCAEDLARGRLAIVLDGWEPAPGNVHAVYPSRRGQPAAVRGFLDYVAPRLEAALERMQAN